MVVLAVVVIECVLYDGLQIGRRDPKGGDGAENFFFKPVVDDHDAGQSDTSFEQRAHLEQGERDVDLILFVLAKFS